MAKIMLNGVNYSAATAVGTADAAYARANSAYARANSTMSRLNANEIAIGYNAVSNSKDNGHDYSIAIGSGSISSSNSTVAIGAYSNCKGYEGIAIGKMTNAQSAGSVALGTYAHTSGNYSVAIGCQANSIDHSSIAIGINATANYQCAALGDDSYAMGANSTAIGHYAAVPNSKSNCIQLGDASSLSTLSCRVSLTVTSDERDKADIEEISDGAVEFLKGVRAIRYVFNQRELYIGDDENLSETDKENKMKYGMCTYDREAHAAGMKKGTRKRAGVSAQETMRALEKVYGSASYANLVNDNFYDLDPSEIPEGVENQLSANYEGFVPFLIKAVQELDERLEKLEGGQSS